MAGHESSFPTMALVPTFLTYAMSLLISEHQGDTNNFPSSLHSSSLSDHVQRNFQKRLIWIYLCLGRLTVHLRGFFPPRDSCHPLQDKRAVQSSCPSLSHLHGFLSFKSLIWILTQASQRREILRQPIWWQWSKSPKWMLNVESSDGYLQTKGEGHWGAEIIWKNINSRISSLL